MLHFFGIGENPSGEPERFSYKINLTESLLALLELIQTSQAKRPLVMEGIKQALDAHLSHSSASREDRQSFRAKTAQILRVRDMAQFLFADPESLALKTALARKLVEPMEPLAKWEEIKEIFILFLQGFDPVVAAQQLGDGESEFALCLQWIALHFLEHDTEHPPAHLRLELVKGQFPKSVWRLKEHHASSSESFWIPENPLCRPNHLAHQLMLEFYKREMRALVPSDQTKALNLEPMEEADALSLEFGQETGQLVTHEESPQESLLALQRMVQQKYSFDGVRHLMALFRQLGQAKGELMEFKVKNHFALLGMKDPSAKQEGIFQEVLELLESIRVKRRYNRASPITERRTPFLSVTAETRKGLSERPESLELRLDRLFLPSGQNPFRLGAHLSLLPEEIFAESPNRHPYLTPLASYLTGSWLINFPRDKGRISQSATELIEGCALRVTAQSKKSILGKLQSELAYMQEKRYIGTVQRHPSKEGNPWLDRFEIPAPEPMMRYLEQGYSYKANPQLA